MTNDDEQRPRCENCQGSGGVEPYVGQDGEFYYKERCPACDGFGNTPAEQKAQRECTVSLHALESGSQYGHAFGSMSAALKSYTPGYKLELIEMIEKSAYLRVEAERNAYNKSWQDGKSEIEKLRAENERLRSTMTTGDRSWEALLSERNQLRTEVERLSNQFLGSVTWSELTAENERLRARVAVLTEALERIEKLRMRLTENPRALELCDIAREALKSAIPIRDNEAKGKT